MTIITTLQQQARALGDPTRYGIFRYVADAGRPVDVAELTAHFGLNHNAIRQHLAKLLDAELVTEETAPSVGRGRPPLCYLVAAAVDGRWGVTSSYERLSLLLSEVIRTGDPPVEVGRRFGRRLRLGATDGRKPVAELVEQMAHQGFDPVVKQRGADVEVILRECPFVTTALADPDTVCTMHLGVAYGIADAVGGLVIDELIPKDPRRAHCRLRGHVEPELLPLAGGA
jgi:predicted ArsR family transcriptional regulator